MNGANSSAAPTGRRVTIKTFSGESAASAVGVAELESGMAICGLCVSEFKKQRSFAAKLPSRFFHFASQRQVVFFVAE